MIKGFIGFVLLVIGIIYSIWILYYRKKEKNPSISSKVNTVYDYGIAILLIMCGIILMVESWIEYVPIP